MSNTAALPKVCDECGKRTNVKNRSTQNPDLCVSCFTKEELTNSHMDGHHEDPASFEKGCYLCNEERNKALEAARDDAGDHWVNVHTRRQEGCIACDAVAEVDNGSVDPIWYEGPETVTIESIQDQVAEEMKAEAAKQAHFDHSACDHPKTAKARAQCRKTGPAAVFHGVIEELPSEDA